MTRCVEGCVVEDDHDQPEDCMTYQDFREEAALRQAEELADEIGWKRVRRGF